MKKVVIVGSDVLGNGSRELGQKLMASMLRRLDAHEPRPCRILFYNSGVKLLASESSMLDAVELLARNGVDLVACGTCVEFYGLGDQMRFGRISDMREIVASMLGAEQAITL